MKRNGDDIRDRSTVEAEVAVVGAGPLGIVTALELARRGHRVVLLDSGRDQYDERIQALARNVGDDAYHAAMDIAVRRQLGGTSNIWGGRCVPFDPIDFERPITPGVQWPISYEEIAAFHQRACDWCVCGEAVFDATSIPELAERQLVPGLPDGDVRTSSLERWSLPTNFRSVYGRELERRPEVDLIAGLTCTRIVCTSDGSSVKHLVAQTLEGTRINVRASAYVLATGGLGATRLLFASDDQHPGGIGNHSGHLGRGYMAHVEARVARVHLTTPADETIYGHERDRQGVYVRRRFTFSDAFLRESGMPNAAVWMVNPELGDARHGNAVLSFVYLLLRSPLGRHVIAEAIRQLHIRTSRPPRVRDHMLNILKGLGPAGRFAVGFGYERFLRPGPKAPGFFVKSKANIYPLAYHGEHLSHPESVVERTSDRDELGLPRLRTHLHYSNEDIASVGRAMEALDGYLREHRVGRLEYIHDDIGSAVRRHLNGAGGYHQTGITRMSQRPDDGVVDSNLAVHGLSDLYVASTTTFPSSSQANPTFAGVAFAVRLADHLHGRLQGASPGASEPLAHFTSA